MGGSWCGRPGVAACLGRMRGSDRSPGALWSPAPLESVDRWPLAIPETQIPGGSHPVGAAVRRCVHGVWTLHPRAVCRSLSAPVRAAWRDSCVRTGAEGLSGGKWMVSSVPPVRRGRRCGRVSRAPLLDHTLYPSGGDRCCRCRVRHETAIRITYQRVIWLILPVVICLSQRLSHACLSISNLYCETANGSLNQLSFI